jgi:hypothetical protein
METYPSSPQMNPIEHCIATFATPILLPLLWVIVEATYRSAFQVGKMSTRENTYSV